MRIKSLQQSIVTLSLSMYLTLSCILHALNVSLTPADDIQKAVDSISRAGGGEIDLSTGTWTLSSSILLASNVKIEGSGPGTTIIQGPSTPYGWPLLKYVTEGLTNVTVENLTLYGQIPQSAFDLNSSTSKLSPYFDACGIYISSNTGSSSGITINNVEIKNTSEGMMIKGVKGLTVTNCNIHDNGGFYWNHNLYFRRCINVMMTATKSVDCFSGCGLHIAGAGSGTQTYSGCIFAGNSALGVNVQDSPSDVTFTNCTINNNARDGLAFTGKNGTIQDNTLNANGGDGIRTYSGSGSIINNTARWNVRANYEIGNSFTQNNNK